MRFTCLIINFLQLLTFLRGPALESRKRERASETERGTRARGTRAEGRMSARNTSSALPNTKTGFFRLSLCSYFIPFVRGTRRTGLQRRLQWAHQSPPTDCGPTDTLEVGINFFVENVEKAVAKWGKLKQLLFLLLFLLPSSRFAVVSVFFFSFQSFHMSKVVRVRPAPCFCQMLVWGWFPSSPLSSFLTFFPSLSCSPLSPTLLTSSLWVQPTWLWAKINAHMCLQLLYTVLMKVRREEGRQMSKKI